MLLQDRRHFLFLKDPFDNDKTSLHILARRNQPHLLKKLVGSGELDLLKVKDASGFTLLHVAAECGQANVVRTILKMDPEIWREKNKKRRTVYHTAAYEGQAEVLEALFDAAGLEGFLCNLFVIG
ncbi:unnamed protein product [Vitrella brassicaformis CCMP3155]|uniref:Uncharacterized protein n=2 Tax=Vitrella brassicaformis TaxID=1169539 RepID=A0A0G4FUX7_VITBC|nr:unnamed protein product [Vitrella brassicaformis CCMP3155]|mmetsp:Transcript_27982/g.69860  ORF Transcript_27982/g.69860 Transcript_27982/m.69860 type:complete len:125 (+) Transcript_27982:479-853(+)|eukprot:CEM18757.1 unnamed protein product [Vitrella brassicaformis CCMP3155]